MIIPEVAPQLTCVASNDGFLYELLLRAEEGKPAITNIRIGPYLFRPDYQPKPLFLGLTAGGPESGLLDAQKRPARLVPPALGSGAGRAGFADVSGFDRDAYAGNAGHVPLCVPVPARRPAGGPGTLPGRGALGLRRHRPQLREVPARRA